MSIKKYTNGSWTPACRKYGTETDSITTLPVTIIGDGTPITSYTIKGNLSQSGTPTPSSPIYPTECGERTENLFDKGNYNLIRANAGTAQNILYGNPSVSPYAVYIPVTGGETYSFYSQATLTSSCFTMETPALGVSIVLNGANTFGSDDVRTAPADAKYLVMFLELASVTQDRLDSDLATLTIVKSSTAPTSYIPYGYKLPLTLGSTTTNIYLGEVQSTRRVNKLVLTGEEDWSKNDTAISGATIFTRTINDGLTGYTPYCTHYAGSNSTTWASVPTNSVTVSIVSDGVQRLAINVGVAYSEIIDFKTYLRQQYAAGTPVTVWYVLETPTTGILNEPIRKIGDYVDSVSGTSLATTGTSQGLDINTTLKPSEADLTYHGWHEHEDTKYST